MRHRRALDEEPVAFEADETSLFAADPGLVPGGFHLGDHLAVLDTVAARIGDHCAQRLCALFVVLRDWTVVAGYERQPTPIGGRDLPTARVFAQNRRAFL